MKKHLRSAAFAFALLAPLGAPAQTAAPAGQTKPAPTAQAEPAATATATAPPQPAPSAEPAEGRRRGRGERTSVTIEMSEQDAQKLREAIEDPELKKKIEEHIDRIGNKLSNEDWSGIAALALLIPLSGIGLTALMVWFIFRGFKSRMQARMDMHNALLAKFSTGAEFTEFISSKGGREYIEQLTAPSYNHAGGFWRASWIGYVCTAMGAGMILVRLIEGGRSIMGGVVLLAIGIGHLLSMRAAKQAAEKISPPSGLNGGTTQPPSLGTHRE